jgi:hypothetical protein
MGGTFRRPPLHDFRGAYPHRRPAGPGRFRMGLVPHRARQTGSKENRQDQRENLSDKTLRFSLLATAVIAFFGASSAHAQQAPQAPNISFFLTSMPIGKGGDFGGLAGADAHCQQLAATAGAGAAEGPHIVR